MVYAFDIKSNFFVKAVLFAVNRKPPVVCFYTKGIVLNRGPLFKRWTLLILRPTIFQSLINGLSILLLLLAGGIGVEPITSRVRIWRSAN